MVTFKQDLPLPFDEDRLIDNDEEGSIKAMMILTTMMTMPAAEPFDSSCPAVRLVQRRPFRWAAFEGQPSVQIQLTN